MARGTLVAAALLGAVWSGPASARPATHGCLRIEDPDLQADHMEITQGVQDGHNEVGLIAGKRTYVRLYGHAIAERGVCLTGARLTVRRGETSVTLSPLDFGGRSLVWSFRTDRFQRGVSVAGFLFEIPSGFRTGTVNLLGVINPEDDPAETRRGNNQVAMAVTYNAAALPDITVYRVSYSLGATAYSTAFSHAEQAMGWLRRAYPVPRVAWTSPVLAWGAGRTGIVDGATALTSPRCSTLNSRLLRILPWTTVPDASRWWAARGITTPNRWVGMVTDQGAFMRGCSADIPSLVASGPTGTTGFAWDTDGSYGDWYTGHELAHTYGRLHAPYCGAEGDRADFPYRDGYISAWDDDREAVVGFDIVTEDVYPHNVWKDVMTYCARQWMSDFTYNRLMSFFTAHAPAARLAALRAAQDPIPLPALVVVGSIDPKKDDAQLDPIFALPPGTEVSPPSQGKYAIVLRSADGSELARYPFEPALEHSGAPLPGTQQQEIEQLRVAQVVRSVPGTREVELQGPGGKRLASLHPGASPPKVELVAPKGGTVVGNTVHVEWQASDPDNDTLSYLLLYSPDGGQTWRPASLETESTSVDVSRESITAGTQALFRVVASDGLNTAFDDSDAPFFVPDVPPTIEIVSPKDQKVVLKDATLGLEAAAYDIDTGALDGKDVQWFSSRDGGLGEGAQLSVTGLTPGEHTIAAFAGNAGQQPVLDTVRVFVVADAAQLPQPPDELVVGPSPVILRSAGKSDAQIVVFDRNGKGLAWSAKPSEPWIKLDQLSGDEPAQIVVSVDHGKLPHPLKPGLRGQVVFTSSDLPGRQWVVEVELERPQDA